MLLTDFLKIEQGHTMIYSAQNFSLQICKLLQWKCPGISQKDLEWYRQFFICVSLFLPENCKASDWNFHSYYLLLHSCQQHFWRMLIEGVTDKSNHSQIAMNYYQRFFEIEDDRPVYTYQIKEILAGLEYMNSEPDEIFEQFQTEQPFEYLFDVQMDDLLEGDESMFNRENKGTILAENLYLTLDTYKSHLNNNIMLVGASGRGKSRNFIKPNIMQMNSNYIVSDPKGVLLKEVGQLLEKNGYKIKLLNLMDMHCSNRYNPFKYISEEADVYKMIDFLIANLKDGVISRADPFWDQSTKALLSALVFYLLEECNPDDQNFTSVLKLLRCAEVREGQEEFESVLDVLFNQLAEKDSDHIAVKQYKIFKQAAGNTAKSILISTSVYLQWFNLKSYEYLTSDDDIKLNDISFEKTALFVTVSDTDRSKNWLAGLFYSQLFDILCRQPNYYHVRFILDDFVCTGKIPDFDYKMAMIRSRNISAIVTIQDEAQLIKEYGMAAKGIISNCDSYVFLGASNIESCDMTARRLSKTGIRGSDIRRLPLDKCIVIYGNQGGIYRKFQLEKHLNYKGIADTEDSNNVYDYNKFRKPSLIRKNSDENKMKVRKERNYKRFPVSEKEDFFDSMEEKYLYMVLRHISNINVFPHQHLRDLFTTTETYFSKKICFMHCDFMVRDEKMNAMFGIEIDGKQHQFDAEQIKNDALKNRFFKDNDIPLLRFKASEVRSNIEAVIEKVICCAKEYDHEKLYVFNGEYIDFFSFVEKDTSIMNEKSCSATNMEPFSLDIEDLFLPPEIEDVFADDKDNDDEVL